MTDDQPAGTGHAKPGITAHEIAAPGIAAIVLAAGRSTRMGAANKLLADLGGKPLIAHGVDQLLGARIGPVVVVTGHDRQAVTAALVGRPVEFVHAPDYAQGLSASLRVGVQALPETVDAALVCLGDMPGLRARVIDQLIAAYAPLAGRSIVRPFCGGTPGNPVLWDRRYFTALMALEGDKGGRDLLRQFSDQVHGVETGDAGVLADVDTPEMLEKMRAGISRF